MHPCEGPAEDLPCIERIQLRRAATHPRKRCKAILPVMKQRLCADAHGGCDRQLRGGKLRGEVMLLLDLRIAPTSGPIELQHQMSLRTTELVDTVLVAVQ